MRLDLSSLQRAITQLEGALRYHDSDLARRDEQLRQHLRAGAIQAFEFTYELSHKMLRRFLRATEPNPSEVASLDFPALIRLGAQPISEMTVSVDIRADHLALLHGILERDLPPGARTWVFGSRARWTTHAGSDLDLAVDAGRPLSGQEVARLRDDLAESDLPYEVDVVDLQVVSESFREVIERDRVPLPAPGA